MSNRIEWLYQKEEFPPEERVKEERRLSLPALRWYGVQIAASQKNLTRFVQVVGCINENATRPET